MTAFPKPTKRAKVPKGLKKTRLRRRATRPRKGADPAYVAWIHTQPCIGGMLAHLSNHDCAGRVEQSHLRSMTGMGRKEPDRNSIPMCSRLHAEWEQHAGSFYGWAKAEREAWMRSQIVEVNAKFNREHPESDGIPGEH